MSWLGAVIAVASALLGGGGVWAFLVARRKTSGSVAQTSSEQLWESSNEHIARLVFRIEQLENGRAETEQRLRDCETDRSALESRLTQVEAETIAAQIVERARLEAAKIREDAADAKAVIVTAAEAAATVVSDTATATAGELERPPHQGGTQ